MARPASRAPSSNRSSSTSTAGARGPIRPGAFAAPARTPPPPIEVPIAWERAVRDLAAQVGIAPAHLVEEHDARAWARFCAGETIEEASAHAYEDIRERFAAKEAA